jgi:hypothetical protein
MTWLQTDGDERLGKEGHRVCGGGFSILISWPFQQDMCCFSVFVRKASQPDQRAEKRPEVTGKAFHRRHSDRIKFSRFVEISDQFIY